VHGKNLRNRKKQHVAVRVRAAGNVSEFRILHTLFLEYESALPEHLRHGEVPALAELVERYAGRNRAFLALVEAHAIGCAAVREFDPQSALLQRLYVTPTARGLGAARALVDAAIEFARTAAYGRIALDTNKEALEPAYRLYRALGFVECRPFTAVTYECPTFMELVFEA
jgi:GNAT superfamily N-acetyltransferase